MTHIYYCILWGICLILAGCIRDDAAYGEAGIVAGDMLATSDLQGKVSVLVFFHTGCPDCQQELPVIQQLYDLYRANDSVAIYCISREEAAEEIEAYWQAHGLTLPYSAQESRSVYNLFSGQGIPRVYVSDKSLQVYSTYSDDPIAGLDELTEDVEALRMKNKE